jgi:hypothetical protein
MSRLQKACSTCAGSSIRATRPANARAQRVNCIAGMNERKCIRTEREARLSSWWPKQGNNAAGQEYSGTPIPLTFKLCSAPRESEAGGRSEEFLEKNDVAGSDTWPVRTGTNPGYVVPRHPDFSLLKYRPPILGISDVGLEARVARMRGRIRGAERWNVAGRDDVHRNPDRSSRPAVLLYSSCSCLR